jgi:excisionase family DNA binding protein
MRAKQTKTCRCGHAQGRYGQTTSQKGIGKMPDIANGKPFAEAGSKSAISHITGPNGAAILTKSQVAELLSCTVRFVERQVRAGRLRACKVTPKFVRIYRKDLDSFLASGATIGDAE